jgi:DNA-binding transcriptional MerR regulator
MSEDIMSLSYVADRLGISTRKLRYYIEKEGVVDDHRLRAGKYKIRYFTAEDVKTITNWWTKINGGN